MALIKTPKVEEKDNIVRLVPNSVDGANYQFNLEGILNGAKEANLTEIAIVGYDDDGELYVASSTGIKETFWLFHKAQEHVG